jgi:biotin carboxyl carrier protein
VQYEVEINGRIRRVAVQRAGGRVTASIDGRIRQVDAARIDAHTMSLLVDEGAASYDVFVSSDPATGLLHVRIGTVVIDVADVTHCGFSGGPSTSPRTARRLNRDQGGDSGAGPQRIVAPMPGKVVRVGVKTGDAVRARQTVVVVEAMKMENELKAARDGVVSELLAVAGASVEAGALLVVIQ